MCPGADHDSAHHLPCPAGCRRRCYHDRCNHHVSIIFLPHTINLTDIPSSPNDVVSLRERSKYQGIIETVSVISNGCGPIIGGALSQYTSWRWAFWINLPLAALAMVITYFFLPLKPVHGDWRVKAKQVDYGGSALTIIAAILVMVSTLVMCGNVDLQSSCYSAGDQLGRCDVPMDVSASSGTPDHWDPHVRSLPWLGGQGCQDPYHSM
jgi:hypothetical protein